jgi:hypothetical protein
MFASLRGSSLLTPPSRPHKTVSKLLPLQSTFDDRLPVVDGSWNDDDDFPESKQDDVSSDPDVKATDELPPPLRKGFIFSAPRRSAGDKLKRE